MIAPVRSPGTWDGSHKEFKTYVEAAQLMERSSDNSTVDVVIVDGRARGDCALEALPYMRFLSPTPKP
jgi:hypothetical protein